MIVKLVNYLSQRLSDRERGWNSLGASQDSFPTSLEEAGDGEAFEAGDEDDGDDDDVV